MPTTITGTDGVSQVQAGAVESGDLPAGSVIQVVSEVPTTTRFITTSTSFVSTGVTVSFTPLFSSSSILITFSGVGRDVDGQGMVIALYRDTVRLGNANDPFGRLRIDGATNYQTSISFQILDTPASNSSLTYDIRMSSDSGSETNLLSDLYDSTLTIMEIAG